MGKSFWSNIFSKILFLINPKQILPSSHLDTHVGQGKEMCFNKGFPLRIIAEEQSCHEHYFILQV
jgi:hypothetical protein